ncbi:hypothetical protein JW930_04015 [Candidatus Woesearchaeota archaeon]|nr:hypothetical protein [Candidatus Woesearchaeota archaeon]
MQKKVWKKSIIDRTVKILEKAEQNKNQLIIFLDKSLYWIGLLTAVLTNFIVTIAMVPVLLIAPTTIVILIVLLYGLSFGFLLDFFIKDIDYLSKKHYVIAGIFLPCVAIINIFVAKFFLDMFPELQVAEHTNLFLVGSIYLVSFLKPHIIRNMIEKKFSARR